MSRRVLVVQHEEICPPGRLGLWLAEAGLELDVVRPYAGEPLPAAGDHDALVVLGGNMGANDDDTHAWLGPTKQLLADAVRSSHPALGVCLGHQLLAVACGGRVQPNPGGQTIGLRPVDLRLSTRDQADPLFADLPVSAIAVHWNGDVVTTQPPRTVTLATTADGSPQVIRVGELAWGVQFHPEVDLGIVSVWAGRTVADGELTEAAADAHLAEITAADEQLVATWRPWAQRFAAMIS